MAEATSLLRRSDATPFFSSSGAQFCTPRVIALSLGAMILLGATVALSVEFSLDPVPKPPTTLRAFARFDNGTVQGFVNFTQPALGGATAVSVALVGVPASGASSWGADKTLHGLHIHSVSDLGNACLNAGCHFVAAGMTQTHGAPSNKTRHTGDFANNLQADAGGAITTAFSDSVISLRPADAGYIVGKPVMLHADQDDYGNGAGGWASTATTGNAGGRIACALIVSAA